MFNGEIKINKVAIYTRVSTEEQARGGFSLDDQLDKLKTFCKAKDWEITGEYIDDGHSGRNIRRPQYKKMFENIDNWDAILVLKLDRIHRKVKNALKMFEDLEKKEKNFVSFMENIDTTTAMGRAMMTIILVFAQLESEQIGERVFSGQNQKAKQGKKFMGHKIPFGYNWNPDKELFIEIPEQIETIKEIFDSYVNEPFNPIIQTDKGWINKITNKLIKKLRDVEQWKTYYDNHGHSLLSLAIKFGFPKNTIRYFLNNVFYVGYERWCHYYRKINNGFNPIISEKLWNEAQIKQRDHCRTHTYDTIMIPEGRPDTFTIGKDERKLIPVLNRAKHKPAF